MEAEVQLRKKLLIEIYDRQDPLGNVIAVWGVNPDRVVFLGSMSVLTRKKHQEFLVRGIRTLCPGTSIDFLPVNPCDTDGNVAKLETLMAETGPETCVADLTGGEPLIVFTLGRLAEKYNIPAVIYRPGSNALRCVSGAEKNMLIPLIRQPDISQMITVAGGTYLRNGRGDMKKIISILTPMIPEIFGMMKSCEREWKVFTAYFQQASGAEYCHEDVYSSPMTVTSGKQAILCPTEVMRKLHDIGIIRDLAMNMHYCRFRLLDPAIRPVLTDYGIWLELYVSWIFQKSGQFDGVETSAVVCWDDQGEQAKVENEIDVIAIRGMGQIFVSCKMGNPDVHALNELTTISRRFGNRYALPMFVCLKDVKKESPAFAERAELMGVEIICGEELEEEKMLTRIKTLCGRWGRCTAEGSNTGEETNRSEEAQGQTDA